MKDKTAATLLSFFLGGVGGHHYYLGNTFRGVLYTLTSITLLPTFFAFIEFVTLAAMSETEFHHKYNPGYKDEFLTAQEYQELSEKLVA